MGSKSWASSAGDESGSLSPAWREKSKHTNLFSRTATALLGRFHSQQSVPDSSQPNPVSFMPDAEGMKEKMREQMCKPKYNVSIYYHKTGFTQWIARHPWFEKVTLLVIGLNALWIWIDTDHNPASVFVKSPPVFQVVEHCFCTYFSFEWCMRFGAFRKKCNGLRDSWFVFDSLLVGTMVFETWLMTAIMVFVSEGQNGALGIGNAGLFRVARLLRLTRMARMARLLRAMPELLILIKGMVAAIRSVCFTLSLLFVMLYIFGITFVQLCDDSACEIFFPDVPRAMHELFLNAALMDSLSNLVVPLKEQSLALVFILYAFIFLSSLTVMNMLIGVICEVVSAVAETEREQLSLSFVHEKMRKLLIDTAANDDHDQTISKEEFANLLVNPKAISILQDVGVDVVGLVDFQDTLFENDAKVQRDDEFVLQEEKTLTISDLMGLVFNLRGGNNATVRDIVNLRKYINGRLSAMENRLSRSARVKLEVGPSPAEAAQSFQTTTLDQACQSIPEEEEIEWTSDSMSRCLSARLRQQLKEKVAQMESSLQGMMSAHEVQVVALESENRQLKEKVAQMERDACRVSVSQTLAPNSTFPPDVIEAPKELVFQFQTGPSVPFSPLRTAAQGSATDSVWPGVDVGAASIAMDTDRTAANLTSFSSQSLSGSQPLVTQSPIEPRNVFAASLVAKTVVADNVEEPW